MNFQVITSILHSSGADPIQNLELQRILRKPFTRQVGYSTGNIPVQNPHLTTEKDSDANKINIAKAAEGKDFLMEHIHADKAVNHCPTLKMCLGYAGCVFKFGIEFCKQDVLPGLRKVSVDYLVSIAFIQIFSNLEYSKMYSLLDCTTKQLLQI